MDFGILMEGESGTDCIDCAHCAELSAISKGNMVVGRKRRNRIDEVYVSFLIGHHAVFFAEDFGNRGKIFYRGEGDSFECGVSILFQGEWTMIINDKIHNRKANLVLWSIKFLMNILDFFLHVVLLY